MDLSIHYMGRHDREYEQNPERRMIRRPLLRIVSTHISLDKS